MTRAAARLYMTQSALSHQLAGLEEAIGISLSGACPRHDLDLAGESS
jgi:hypothetical protein